MSTAAPVENDVELQADHVAQKPSWLVRIKNNVAAVLRQDVSPSLLALSLSIGLTCGLFPIPGTTSVIVIAVALLMRLNIPAAQLINLLVTPIELMAVPAFLYFGESLAGVEHISLSPAAVVEALKTDMRSAVQDYGWALVYAVLGWLVFVLPATLLLHVALTPLVTRVMTRQEQQHKLA